MPPTVLLVEQRYRHWMEEALLLISVEKLNWYLLAKVFYSVKCPMFWCIQLRAY